MLRPAVEPTFEELLDQHPQLFAVPDHLLPELETRGELPRWEGAPRVAPRFRCSGLSVVECLDTPQVLAVWQPTLRSLVKDVSRSGMSFLNGCQYYPDQKLKISLPIATAIVRVARCKFLGQTCFETGVKTIEYYPRTT